MRSAPRSAIYSGRTSSIGVAMSRESSWWAPRPGAAAGSSASPGRCAAAAAPDERCGAHRPVVGRGDTCQLIGVPRPGEARAGLGDVEAALYWGLLAFTG